MWLKKGNVCFPTEDSTQSSFLSTFREPQTIACNLNITALSGTDSIYGNLKWFKSKACKRRKRKKGGGWALQKLHVCTCRGSAKWSRSWSQTSIGRSQHQGTISRHGGASTDQNKVECIRVSCEAKMSLTRQECLGHKRLLMVFAHADPHTGCSRRQEQCGMLSEHLQTSHCSPLETPSDHLVGGSSISQEKCILHGYTPEINFQVLGQLLILKGFVTWSSMTLRADLVFFWP